MRTIVETTGTQQVDVHYVNTGIPAVIEQNFGGNYPEHGDLSLDEVLDQEIVYQSFQMNSGNDKAKASASSDSNSGHDQSGGERQVPEKDGESSQAGNVEFQLASDEALARALQLLDFDESLSESIETPAAIDREVNSAEPSAVTSAPVVEQDNIDPDSMSYEELLSLEEVIGTESRGLSEGVINLLPSSKYKTGFFSRKDKNEACVICHMSYKNGDGLITLPCKHQYHSKCVTRWLKINKACPVCYEEVFG